MRTAAPLALLLTLAGCASGPPQIGDSFKDCKDCPEMVVIPAGQFEMGSPTDEQNRDSDEGPVRTVTHTKPFAIGKYEITRKQFAAFVNDTGHWGNARCLIWNGTQLAFHDANSWLDPDYTVSDDHPMVCVSWWDAVAYADWLTETTGYIYRLPSEAEWEYAVRGGTQTAYSFPGGPDDACAYANVSDLSAKADVPTWNAVNCEDGVGFGTAPVGSYLPNGFGLHDTIGNVWEWQADCYRDSFEGAPTDGSAWGNGGLCNAVLDRGGGFSNIFPGHLRAANRSKAPSPHIAVYSLGFRLVRELEVAE
ncbi:MAG: formylglycine-generating enzyme family protein [Rhodospirillaceae bacterium]